LIRSRNVTCADCYFRQAGLCALATQTPCPTYRPASQGSFAPPPEPRLSPHLGRVVAQYAAAT